ncbi:MAG TPA: manganese efflux pump MntP family protein [bacterium]|nr:manganese efflux pump MntP family protein [bacterium]
MGLGEIFLLALALAADAFGVGTSIGLTYCRPRQVFRLSWHFGLFQALMPALGALAGLWLRDIVATAAPIVAGILLTIIGAKMLIESMRQEKPKDDCDPTRGWTLIGLSLAVSIDAFAAGIGLAMLQAPLLLACVIIGIVALIATAVAMLNSRLLRKALGQWAERFGGIVLLLLAAKAFLHL